MHPRVTPRDEKKLLKMIRTLEKICDPETPNQSDVPLPDRLEALDLKVLAMTEAFYERTYEGILAEGKHHK